MFTKVESFKREWTGQPVTRYVSSETGMNVVLVDFPGPIINAYIAVATEVHNDSGTPHTLEHLCFMGSKSYPYKGFLDQLANKLYGTTNAWTDTDQTVYTLSKAGDAQFAKLLAIYLDHVINPTLQDSSCFTEVYHVTPKAREAGVVFSEMQAHAHSAETLMENETQKRCYPETSAYRSETGGMLDPLRTLSNESIKDFHKSMYAPDNMVLVVAGQVDQKELFEQLEKFEKASNPGTHRPFRPFVDTEPEVSIAKSETVSVEFPDEDEEFGKAQVTFVGPDHSDGLATTALDILGYYLTDSAASLLQKQLVEIAEPLATHVSYYTRDYLKISFSLELDSVPMKELEGVPGKMLDLIKDHKVDIQRMRDCLENQKLALLKRAEENSEFLCTTVIEHFLYGKGTLEDDMKLKDILDELAVWSSEQWTETMIKWFIDNNSITVLGRPSAAMADQLPTETLARRKMLEQQYGEEGLKKQQELLDAAEAEQNQAFPDKIMDEFKITDPKIEFLKSETKRYGRWAGEKGLSVHYEEFESNFINIDVCLGSTVDKELLPLIHLIYAGEIFTFPVEGLSTDEVISGLNRDTIQYYCYASYKGFNEVVMVHVEVEQSKYEAAVTWIQKCLLDTVWDSDRVQICIDKALNNMAESKRHAESRLASAKQRYLFADSLIHSENLADFETWLKTVEVGKAVEQLKVLQKQLLKKDIFVTITGKVSGNVTEPWSEFYEGLQDTSSQLSLPRAYEFLSDMGKTLSAESVLVPMSNTKTSHLQLMSRMDLDYSSADRVPLLVACEYFQCVEGPFWVGLRGKGYVYGAQLSAYMESKRLQFEIYRSSNVYTALTEAKKIVCETKELDDTLFVGAKRSVINNYATGRASNSQAASFKTLDVEIKFRSEWTTVAEMPNFVSRFVDQVEEVTEEQVLRVIDQYILPLFQGAENTAIFCALNAGEVDAIKTKFESDGYNVLIEEFDEGESDGESGDESDSEDDESGSEDESEEEI